MGCIIITMPRQKDAIRLKEIIRHSGLWEEVVISGSGAETLSLVSGREVSVVICTKKATDMGYEELRAYLPEHVTLLLLTQDAALTPFGTNVVKLLMPFRSDDLISSLKMLIPASHRPRRQSKKPPARSLEEQKLIDEAKAVLMNRNDMTEPEAFRYIQKTSMDTSRTMVETAQMILLLNGR